MHAYGPRSLLSKHRLLVGISVVGMRVCSVSPGSGSGRNRQVHDLQEEAWDDAAAERGVDGEETANPHQAHTFCPPSAYLICSYAGSHMNALSDSEGQESWRDGNVIMAACRLLSQCHSGQLKMSLIHLPGQTDEDDSHAFRSFKKETTLLPGRC